ncbi:hypothetical protein CMI47_12745 [Candidatus Pacearchaeota archaeon]|nr:hypothetical protein [Candidatus Pacearchaeota archaeon]|tara:strand:+ start:948 stop:1259 length:312 start_codon:yes stop_codon:yes gene_type:complete
MFNINTNIATHNKVDIHDFIKTSKIKDMLPNIMATIYIAIEDINFNEKNSTLTLEEFIECVPNNRMLKVILYCAQNDTEIMKQCMHEVEKIKLLKEKIYECRK